jgi:subtilisin family serine protease
MSLRLLNRVKRKPAAGFARILRWVILLCCFLTATTAFAASEKDPSDRSSQIAAFVPGELLVKFRAEVRKEAAADFQRWFGISTRKTFAINGYQLVKLPEGADIEEALELYLEDPDVEHAEPNYLVYADATTPDDAEFTELWGLNNTAQNVNGTSGTFNADIDAPEAWDVTTGSSAAVVAVIDSGVDVNHPDLQSNIWINTGEIPNNGIDDDLNGYIDDVNGWDFYVNDNDPRDAHGHGTHVAGTIAAVGNNGIGIAGVSWSAQIMPLRFLDAWGNGTTANAIAAIEYASNMGADIINNSWGGGPYVQALKDAIDASDALIVCAAGNSGRNNDGIAHYPSSYSSTNIIAVAASNQDDQLAWFSNHGAVSVDVAAPGTNIYSAAPGRKTVWQDNFSGGNTGGWSPGGINSSWDATDKEAFSDTYSLTDSPNANYLNDTFSWMDSPAVDLTDQTASKLEFKIFGTVHASDGLWVQASSDGINWDYVNFQLPGDSTLVNGVSGTFGSWTTIEADLEAYDGLGSVYVSFLFISDSSNVADGYYIDDVKITAAATSVYDGTEYTYKQGTSMATPHVAGLAALIIAHNPALTNLEIKALIENSVDPIPALNDKVATDGRINAAAALAAPQISNVQVTTVTETTAQITWTTGKPADSVVQYGTTGNSWDSYPNTESDSALVTSHSITLSGLTQETDYYFMVGSTDAYGNGPDNRSGDANPSAEVMFTTANADPPSIVQFPTLNFAADTITVTYDEENMKGAAAEDNYSFSPSMNFVSVDPKDDDITDLGSSAYRLAMASIPAYEIFTLTVSGITDLAGNPVTPASITINDNDGDGMAGDWETANGLNPLLDDSAGDPDGDGYTNLQEYEARTHPRSAAEAPFVVKDSIPLNNAGIATTQRVPNNTDFAVLLESAHGINTTINTSVKFTINDGVNGVYSVNLGDPTVRFEKLTADPDNQVTRMWVVYERSQDDSLDPQNFPYDSNVNIKVDASDVMANDMIQASIDFNVETLAEHNDAQDPANLPDSSLVAEDDPDIDDALEGGIQIDSGDLAGAKVIYDIGEPRKPAFGPVNEIPPLSISGAVGVPLNLLPHTVFEEPVRVFIPCPGYTDVSGLSVYYYNGSAWVRACDAAGNVLTGGDGWMVPGSRVNHNETNAPTIEIQVYHFSGAQAGVFSGGAGGGGGGGGGGGCFITAASQNPVIKHLLFYVLLNLALIGLGIFSIKKLLGRP